ncbi:outer membrane beta-barrel protein [Zunongwangia sp. F363]|uniref:Outer membrane beta-barrel protein n=1 Tax=Autumnicola tepida TaxID=3075595 RepID=A0ABU3C500_9FLAO|nr:outer membrane beta-barrel protein [Zunongwangia sp. F363]MDT0641420.1 outer membrane beta-barrel protein [Zunongwangia sp. F363]
MKFYLSLALVFLSGLAFSQQFEVTGKVVDEEGQPLESATVYLEKAADSSLVTYTISEGNGSFRLTGRAPENTQANLIISFAGYKPLRKSLQLKNKNIALPAISMEIEDNELEEVMVTATRAPITIKKDTLEFNADSFNTRQDANLEELMKKLPGVEVDNEGNITVNGKPVSRILVNGEEFFGNDPKIATKNLPKEIINKIQVTDTKTKSEEFTGKAGDPDNKTVNITIKEDKNKGYFARATAGGGTDERYELSGIGNYYKDNLRITALASSNNINTSGFSYDEVFGMMGRTAGRNIFGGGGGGITKAETAGLNFVNKWDEEKEIELSTDYLFERGDTETRTVVARENFLPDSLYYTNSEQRSNLLNDSHNASVRFEVEFDTLTRLSVRPRLDADFGHSYRSRTAESLDEGRNLVNSTETSEDEELNNVDFSNDIDFIRRFGSRGAYLQLEFSNDHSRQKNDNFFYSEFYESDEALTEVQDQYIDEDENENNYSFEVSKRSVLADQFFLDVSYDFDYENSTNKRYVYENDDAGGDSYNQLNELLSSDFEVTSRRHIPNLGLNYEGDIWRVNTEVGLLHTSLENSNYLEETSFDNIYNNLFLEAGVRYEIERSKSLSVRYNTNVDIPSIRQLQPVVDRTNPLNIVVGNPELEPTYRQSINLNYRNFDFATRSGIFSWMNFDFYKDNVVQVSIVEDGRRTTTYTNVDGAMNANMGAFYNKQYKTEASTFRYNVGFSASYNKSVGFINGEKFHSERYNISPRLRLSYEIEELLNVEPNYELTFNKTQYDISSNRNEQFTNHRAGLEVTTYWPENVVFGNDISYNYFGIVSPGFDNSSILWNMSLGYEFLDDNATIKLKVYDLLDQNINTRREIGDDYIQDVSSLILTRYAMLSFTYKIKNFGGSSGPDQGRGRGYRR